MPDENASHQSIGDPQPVQRGPTQNILEWLAAGVVCAGGFMAFAFLATPTRLSGASRSAQLIWQYRQSEIQQTIESAQGSNLETSIRNAQSTVQ